MHRAPIDVPRPSSGVFLDIAQSQVYNSGCPVDCFRFVMNLIRDPGLQLDCLRGVGFSADPWPRFAAARCLGEVGFS